MLYLVGLGLSSPKDITLAGLDAVQRSQRVYLEAYTSILMDSRLEELVGLVLSSQLLANDEVADVEEVGRKSCTGKR